MSKHRSAVTGDLIQVYDDEDRTSTRCRFRLFYEVPAGASAKTIAAQDGSAFLDYSRLAKISLHSEKFVAAGDDT